MVCSEKSAEQGYMVPVILGIEFPAQPAKFFFKKINFRAIPH
jgi:hypothetical protein